MQLQWPDKLNEEAFLKHYWQARPLLLKNALPDFENPLSPDELGGLALDEEVASRIILREDDKKWHCRFGPFSESDLTELPPRDWSLLVTDVEKHLPEFRQWLQAFNFIPKWRIDDLMISYAPSGASVGAHVDNYDVFLLQAAGQREWSITENPDADLSYLPDQDIRILANFEPDNTWVLNPGDILYLPPGVPHHGISLDNNCMTWSIGFRAPSHREIVTAIASKLVAEIPESAFYADPALDPQEHQGEISEQALRRVREVWNSWVHPESETFARFAAELLTTGKDEVVEAQQNTHPSSTPRADEPNGNSDEQLVQRIGTAKNWEPSSHSRMAFIRSGAHAELYIDGEHRSCSIGFAQYITEHIQYSSDALLSFTNEAQNCQALQWMIQNEKLLVDTRLLN